MTEEKNKPKRKVLRKRKELQCRSCKSDKGLIRKYNLNICRRCFKEMAEDLGFKKYGLH